MTTTLANKKALKDAKKNKQSAPKKDAKKASKTTGKKDSLTRKALLMKAQFITDSSGKKVAVVLPVKAFEKVMEDLEELDDIRLFDRAKRSAAKGVPMKDAFSQVEARRGKKA